MNRHLSVIIPCYNEEKRLPSTLVRVLSYLHSQTYSWEVIVVDNGSEDGTAGLVKATMEKEPNLKLLDVPDHGKGWAVRQGMLAAQGDYRLFTDADNSTDIAQLEKLLEAVKNGFDVAVSSRKIAGASIKIPQPQTREILGRIFRCIVSTIVPTGIKDTQNGFKLFSREAAEKIFPLQKIYYWAFDVEILAIARKFNFKIKEVPIEWNDDGNSHVNLKGMVRMLWEVLRVRLNLWRGKYK